MKRLVYLFSVILLLGLVSASPLLYFVNPTPANNYETTPPAGFGINISVEGVENTSEINFYWEGTNYTFYDSDLVLMLNLNNNSALGENDTVVVGASNYTNNGSVTGATFTASGKYGGGFSFDAEDEYINLSDRAEFRYENFSVSMWVNVEDMNVKQISAFGHTTCVLLNRGDVYCVGDNSNGQLGDGTTTNNPLPQLVLGSYNFSKLDNAGYPDSDHMCGILQNGSVMCWGLNNYGQLGDNSSTQRTSPVAVNGSYNFSEISTGRYHTCGLLTNSTVLCWGRNDKGQLGDNTTTPHNIPGPLLGEYNFTKISSGDDGTCGILTNGSALCWGRAAYGALGDGQSSTNKLLPTNVSGNYNFTYITNGNQVACGILINGSALCWGGNDIGSYLGNGSEASSSVPVAVSGNYNWSYLEQSYGGVCGILVNGSALCWGHNANGFVGNGDNSIVLSPVFVSGNYNFSNLSVGYLHTCGLLTNGSTVCWGRDSNGQLGKGVAPSTSYPLPVQFFYGNFSGDSYSNKFDLGSLHTCAVLGNGNISCWGFNNYGQLGDNTTTTRDSPLEIYGNYNFSSVSSGGFGSCGILVNGSALCWGLNNDGQIGDGTTIARNISTPVSGDYNFSYLSGGGFHTCGILVNGSAMCWGDNTYGQLGNGTTGGDALIPAPVLGNYNFSQLIATTFHTCGILQNGSAMCWGRDTNGQLGCGGCGNQNVPTSVSGDYNFSSLALGTNSHTCGILTNGTALCWGRNLYGEIGDGTSTNPVTTPVSVDGNYNFSQLSGGIFHTCGVLTNGTAMCWGRNDNWGQLGDGTLVSKNSPVAVNINEGFSYIFSDTYANFGILTDGRIVSWGENDYGQLAFSSYNQFIPSPDISKGNILGKNIVSFKMHSTFEGNLRAYTGYSFEDVELNSGWNHVALTYDGTTAKIYVNGSLENSFNPPIFAWYNDTTNLLLGEDTRGTVDEVMMWNRTLTASEISELYKSNLNKKNSTVWEFYSGRTSLSEGTYTYGLFFTDLSGQLFSSGLRNFIVRAASSSAQNTQGSPGIAVNYKPTREQLIMGYSRLLRAGNKVTMPYENEIIAEVKSVDSDSGSVTVSVGGSDYDVAEGGSIKIDTNDDGYYDLEILVSEIRSNGYANFEFREIYEKVLVEDEGTEDNKGLINDIKGGLFSNEGGVKVWVWIVIGILVVGVGVYFLLRGRKGFRFKIGKRRNR